MHEGHLQGSSRVVVYRGRNRGDDNLRPLEWLTFCRIHCWCRSGAQVCERVFYGGHASAFAAAAAASAPAIAPALIGAVVPPRAALPGMAATPVPVPATTPTTTVVGAGPRTIPPATIAAPAATPAPSIPAPTSAAAAPVGVARGGRPRPLPVFSAAFPFVVVIVLPFLCIDWSLRSINSSSVGRGIIDGHGGMRTLLRRAILLFHYRITQCRALPEPALPQIPRKHESRFNLSISRDPVYLVTQQSDVQIIYFSRKNNIIACLKARRKPSRVFPGWPHSPGAFTAWQAPP